MLMINRMAVRYVGILILLVVFASCRGGSESVKTLSPPGKSEMEDMNRFLVQKDRERIQNYIERKNLQMIESPTGLWYQIIKEGSGKHFGDNDKIVFDYSCSLLDGTLCYSSEDTGSKDIILGKSQLEAGLNEGFRLLRPGAEAIFILPPFLAYGLVGDGASIPSRSVIVYNINILQPR
jgi:FKBP-type peptidyl-prolyl cis-trans isomerase